MPVRFVAVISSNPDTHEEIFQRVLKGAQLSERQSFGRLSIFTDNTSSFVSLDGKSGGVVGHLFARQPIGQSVARFDPAQARSVLEGGSDTLLHDYWGGYVAFLSPAEDTIEILRDPSGGLPCYSYKYADALLLTSDVETLQKSGCLVPEIDWRALAGHLYFTDLRLPGTCLAGVTELLPGQAMLISRTTVSICARWSPWNYLTSGQVSPSPEDLRLVVTGAVQAWASRFSHVALGVSGGLDSSILAAVLKDQPRLISYTFATEELDGDERRYARILTKHLGIDLQEGFHQLDEVDITRSVSTHLPRPVGFAFGQSLYAYLERLAEREGVDAWFSGVGGDNVFCFMTSATPFVDRLSAQGLIPSLTTLLDVCDLTGATLWDALRNAYLKVRKQRRQSTFTGDGALLVDQDFDDTFPEQHPWLSLPTGALSGKAVHVGMLVRIQGTIDGLTRFGRGTRVTPLLSQPIVETCLSVPTWRWCENGRDRAVARQAFQHLLPPAIVNRRSKGGPGTFAYNVLSRNQAKLREQLLDGLLAKHNVINVTDVERALAADNRLSGFEMSRLSSIAEAEAWARHWAVSSSLAADCPL